MVRMLIEQNAAQFLPKTNFSKIMKFCKGGTLCIILIFPCFFNHAGDSEFRQINFLKILKGRVRKKKTCSYRFSKVLYTMVLLAWP